MDLRAPAFELPDVDENLHRLDDWLGMKKLLVTFSSWCGCRYDLPGWQALHDELAPRASPSSPWPSTTQPPMSSRGRTGISLPVLYDPNHLLTELYAISNVPTVLWIDEENRIVRPNGSAFGSDLFADFTGVESGPHLDDVRRWVAPRDRPGHRGRGPPGGP